jgi:hypothetical protein
MTVTPEEAQRQQQLVGLIDEWFERTSAPPAEVQSGSELDEDDRATDYLHVSHMVTTSLIHAVDHLYALRTLLVDARVLHTSADFTLVRSGLENAATAVWLLAPQQPRERRLRRLRLALADAKDAVEVFDMVKLPTRSLAERRADVVSIAARSGIEEPALGTRQPGFEAIVRAASHHVGDGDLHQLVWKGCSGLAHGRQWATVALLKGDEQSREGDVSLRQVTAGHEFVVNAASSAGVLVRRAFQLLDYRRLHFRGTGPRLPPSWLVNPA